VAGRSPLSRKYPERHKISAGGRPSGRTPDGLPPDLEILCYVPLPPMTGEGVRESPPDYFANINNCR
jgi:hypothetical protein